MLVTSLAASTAPSRASTVLDEILPHVTAAMGETLKKTEVLLEKAKSKIELPPNPTQALIDAVRSLSSLAGVPQDPGPAIRAAALPNETASSLALVAQGLLQCAQTTVNVLAGIPRDQLARAMREDGDGGGLDPKDFKDVRPCSEQLWVETQLLETSLVASQASAASPPGSIDVWPVLRFEPSGANNFYSHDYLLLVDQGGDDIYMNNAGSNMVDVRRGPVGSLALQPSAFAPGCQEAVNGLANGDCVPLAAVLLDTAGNDTYGVKQTPDIDARCTADLVIRRMVIIGQGFAGVGILRDTAGNDRYTGKQVTIGAGHVFGVGILSDVSGNDGYSSVRNAGGFALVGGIGILRDEAGNDSHDFYLPSPLNPLAVNETDGAGGVIDDTGNCDNRLRFSYGTANVGPEAVGILINDAGNDTYRGGFSNDFAAPAGQGRGGSLGFANNAGVAVLLDRAGNDGYTIVNQVGTQGSPARGNRVTIAPGQDSTGQGGVFIDE